MRLGIDVGGTFTDLVYLSRNGEIQIEKVPSRPEDPFAAVQEGLKRLNVPFDQIQQIAYGTTIATNCVLEKKGAKTGLLCTLGFRDILEHQRWHRRTLYDLHQTRPSPLAPRHLRLEVTERTSAQGEVVTEADPASIRTALEIFEAEGVESIAICFLNAHANGHNERVAKQILQEYSSPAYISLSSEIAPMIREWERTNTTVLNAYTQPIVDKHLHSLQRQMENHGLSARLDIMQSNGGIISIREAADQPVKTILSGPAGGVMGSQFVGDRAGHINLITLDLGGTSCDVSVVRNGEPIVTKEGMVEYNMPITTPMIDIQTIGAGGGSIAWIDRGDVIKVGPQSAGAVPGPACYGRGGQEPTVTDAQLLLGRLSEDGLLRGRMRLDRQPAEEAFKDRLCQPLGLDLIQTTSGVIRIINTHMAEAIRLVTTDQGRDPRDFTLLAFGGAGPLHACELADELGIERILIPRMPGVLSALGLAGADIKTSFLIAINRELMSLDPLSLENLFVELENRCSRVLAEHGLGRGEQLLSRSADIRYPGQSFEVTISLPEGPYDIGGFHEIAKRFHEAHQDLYKYSMPQEAPFLVNIEVAGLGRTPKPLISEKQSANGRLKPVGSRTVYFLEQAEFVDTPVYLRELLQPDHIISGPALVDQFDSTVLITSGFAARVDAYDNLMIERKR